ncbi:MerR family transcriptional regulator [Paeniglutamicibacter quisquiliarum]|uniref:MerR family transcriptional regulator n=1 Tax=Paeniglutamicibacter quisquiliarum TaxID=2849498 RepID=UPI0020C499FB|nr:MerR family transcriptional regulator [Paeniglutamicibacter quisquiliarum]
MSELLKRSGMPLATVKYYLREGLLAPGEKVGATMADYGEEHVRRLALIRALTEVVGLPIAGVRTIVGLIDEPEADRFSTLGRAIEVLPPAVEADPDGDYPRARAALEEIGQLYDPGYAAVAQLERGLAAAESVGLPMGRERLHGYARHIMAIAEIDLAQLPGADTPRAVEYSVLGTAVYEPILAAMRRLAHQDLASRMLGGVAADRDR